MVELITKLRYNNRCNSALHYLTGALLACCLVLQSNISLAQKPVQTSLSIQHQNATVNSKFVKGLSSDKSNDVFGKSKSFIENIGQYGNTVEGFENLGKIEFAYEGLKMPVLFTSKGVVFVEQKIQQPTEEEKEAMERKGMSAEEIASKTKTTNRFVSLEWEGANPNAQVLMSDETSGYFSYGMFENKAASYKKITLKELYPGIDVEYFFTEKNIPGFEYSIVLKPNADLSKVKLVWGGDVKSIVADRNKTLVIKSEIGTLTQSAPISFCSDNSNEGVAITSQLSGNVLTFQVPQGFDLSRGLVIDPFISGTGNLTGTNSGKAKDVDFDYAGNVYVTGGGDGNVYQLAKYNSAGVWQWTFNGSLTIPYWVFGTYFGGWVVDKTTGNIYLGQGFNYTTGFQVIRLTTAGLYDNYVTTANVNFKEDWKMYWSCNNGVPQILVAGGGTNSNINFGIVAPPSTTISSLNVTGIAYGSSGWAQDIADVIIDPVTNDMYTIYGSLIGTPTLCNTIYKNAAPYSSSSVAWNLYSGFTVIQEIAGRPYMLGGLIENSVNVFAINSSYLFYWDGKNLKAFNKATGAGVGSSLTIALNTALWCGGIIADECNNIYVGSTNGTIKVYKFNGSTFDDAAAADILITGYTTKSVYDLAFDEAKTLLYASGDGFVASFDVSSYACPNTSYTITATPNCATASVTSAISPAPPLGSIITFQLFDGVNFITSNSTGTFTGLTPGITYTIIAYINQTCSGTSTTIDFILPGPALTTNSTSSTCGNSTGTITASGSGGTLPYAYSKDGITFQSSGNFTGLAAGVYNITIKDAGGCSTTTTVTITNSNGPSITFSKTDAVCGNSTGTITANGSGGTPPLEYSINGITYQSNNVFAGLAPGTYTLTVKDAVGCLNSVVLTIISSGGPSITATPASTFCNTNNGTITATVTGGASPYQYSIDGNNYQSSNVITGLYGGVYTVTVKDANGCISTVTVTVANSAGPTVTATTTSASCGNSNGTITAIVTGGTSPITYSINGVTFQSSNFFGGLTSGSYTVTVKDANGCINTVTVTVASTNSPTVTATSVSASCNSSNGSVTAVGSGGTGALTYSINGFTFQASTLFSGLAPGTYTVLVKDANGCIGATIVVVGNATGPTVSAITTPVSCGLVDGIITANGTGGTLPYQFSLNGGAYQSSGTFSGLAVGNYTITIKDNNGCTNSITIVLSNASGLSLTASSTSTPCSGSNGTITALATGGVGALQYSINGITYQSSNVFTSVSSGTYTVTVKDINGCTATSLVTVSVVFAPTVTATVVNANCNSINGSITATGSGGTAPLTYSINGVTFQSSGLFTGVAPGTYTVTVKDAVGCTGTVSVTITNVGSGSPPSVAVTLNKTDPCGLGDGKITLAGSGGTGPYTYSIDGVTFQSSGAFTGVVAGTYNCVVKDANGCTASIVVVVANTIPGLTATVTNATCGSSNGSIVAIGSGGDPPFKYSLNGGAYQSSGTFSGLASGTYTITVKDGEPCFTTITVNVLSTGGPTVTAVKADCSCGLNNGTITATGTGGTLPLTYNINNGAYQSLGSFTGLAAGTYTILVKDAIGCLGAVIVTINGSTGPTILASATATSCGQLNGTITASGNGGNPPLQYSINGTVFQSSTLFTGLASGTYTVWVKDNSECFKTTTVTITNTSMPNVTAYSIAASCGNNNGSLVATGSSGTSPYQYSINGIVFQSSATFTGLAAGAYTITVKDVNGCVNTTTASVTNLTAPTLTTSAVASKCSNANGTITATGSGGSAPLTYSIDGITFQSGTTFSNVASGTYTVTVKDNNGCIATKLTDVSNIAGPSTLTAAITNSTCGSINGKIVATATGGTAPLTYSIDGVTFQSATTFNSVTAGSYTLTVKDANGCIKTLPVNVINLEGPLVSASPTPSSCFSNDATITVTATGGTGIITYNKNGGSYQSSNVFTGLAAGSYTMGVKDANGCVATTVVAVTTIGGPSVSASVSSSGCNSGTITATATGGTPSYTYSIDGVVFQSSNIFTCMLDGTYTVTVKDSKGCIATYDVVVAPILPISLLYFTASAEIDVVDLKWETATEINNDYFTVEKLLGDDIAESIAVVDGSGNSSNPITYLSHDFNPSNGINYYRLMQTDFSGINSYSEIVSVDFTGINSLQLYPNPAAQHLYLLASNTIKQIRIMDVTGRVVIEMNGKFTDLTAINISSLASGCYMLDATDNTGIKKSQVFIKGRNDE